MAAEETVAARQHREPPHGAVLPVAGAVQDDADHLSLQPVVRHATGYMGVMVLDRRHHRPLAGIREQPGQLRRQPGGGVARVQFAADGARPTTSQIHQPAQGRQVVPLGLHRLQVAQVLAQHGLPARKEAEGHLLLTARAQALDLAGRGGNCRWDGDVAARSADEVQPAGDEAYHRVVAPVHYVAVGQ